MIPQCQDVGVTSWMSKYFYHIWAALAPLKQCSPSLTISNELGPSRCHQNLCYSKLVQGHSRRWHHQSFLVYLASPHDNFLGVLYRGHLLIQLNLFLIFNVTQVSCLHPHKKKKGAFRSARTMANAKGFQNFIAANKILLLQRLAKHFVN